jgi:AcrR family transcriptional regulator
VRRQEIIDAAAAIALDDGLSAISARRVATRADIPSGLVTHYFASIEELTSAAFVQLVTAEREGIGDRTRNLGSAVERLRATIAAYVAPGRDRLALLWLDAWRQAADHAVLRTAVIQPMERDVVDMAEIITSGTTSGVFHADDEPTTVAMRILALLDGQTAASAIRTALAESTLDYPAVEHLLIVTAERELGLAAGTLAT